VTDLAVDTPPDFPASTAAAGPTLAPEELAGRKLLALSDRAAARDFADVRLLARLADYAIALGRQAVPEVVLHPSVAERFTCCAPDLSGVARRTLRTNLRFIGRRVVPHLHPADLPLPRERAKAPYAPAEVAGYLAMADVQPTAERRMRLLGSGDIDFPAMIHVLAEVGFDGDLVVEHEAHVFVDKRGPAAVLADGHAFAENSSTAPFRNRT
jgi:hypothetical protein